MTTLGKVVSLDAKDGKSDNEKYGYEAISTVLNSLDALVYVSDLQTYDMLFMNDYGISQFGDIANRKCYQVLQAGQSSPCAFCTNHKLVDELGQPNQVHVWEFQNTKNERWYQCRDQAIKWPDGRLVRIEIATDITDRKLIEQKLAKANERAEHLANTDELTNGYNRRAFFNFSRKLISQAMRSKQKLSVVMFDLDHFKHVNDQWGHSAGDAVLIRVANLVHNIVREADVFARLGGEEFALILPNTSLEQAEQLAERVRREFELDTVRVADVDINFTASFGIASADFSDVSTDFCAQEQIDNLVNKADSALMQAKRMGRNRVLPAKP